MQGGAEGINYPPKYFCVGKFLKKNIDMKGIFTIEFRKPGNWGEESCIWVHFEMQFHYADTCTTWVNFSLFQN